MSDSGTDRIVTVALIEDDLPYRAYIAALLESTGRMKVVLEAGSAEAAWPRLAEAAPQVLLLDIGLPGSPGFACVERALTTVPGLLVVMLTGRDGDEPLLASIRAGACGYLLKGGASAEVIAAVDDAVAGGAPMSPTIARKLLELMRRATEMRLDARDATENLAELTPREREVLELVANGASDKEAAAQLGLSRSTVKNVLGSIYGKWRVRSRTEATVKFLKAQGG